MAKDDAIIDFVVTGATGWLGRVTLDVLGGHLGSAVVGQVRAFGSKAGLLRLGGGTELSISPLNALDEFQPTRPTMVFHHAFLTKDRVAGQSHETYRAANLEIRQTVVRFIQRTSVAGLMVPSSGAVYQYLAHPEDNTAAIIYGHCKYEDEQVFGALAQKQGIRAVIPRVFNLGGAHINKHQSYALASIIRCCLRGEPVSIRAAHPVWRSYYAGTDLVELVLRMIRGTRSADTVTFDTVGTEVVEVGELAQRCLRLLKCDSAVERPLVVSEPNDFYVGSPAAVRALEGRYNLRPTTLDRQILETAEFLRAQP